MALETLKDEKSIGGFSVIIMDDLKAQFPGKFDAKTGAMDYKWFEAEIRPKNFVYIRQDVNSIAFTIQKGPIKENGVNGCQVDTMVMAALLIIKRLNVQFPCPENEAALNGLSVALAALKARTANRERRGVEGTDKR